MNEKKGTPEETLLNAIQTTANKTIGVLNSLGDNIGFGAVQSASEALERCARAYALVTGTGEPKK